MLRDNFPNLVGPLKLMLSPDSRTRNKNNFIQEMNNMLHGSNVPEIATCSNLGGYTLTIQYPN